MKVLTALLATVATLLSTTSINIALAHDTQTDNGLMIEHPWAKPSIPGGRVSAGYIEIENNGARDDVLLGAQMVGIERVMIHSMRMDGDIMRMERLEDPLVIPAGGYVSLQPGGLHLMLMGLEQPLVEDAMVKATLSFQHAGDIEVEFMIEALTKADQRAEAKLVSEDHDGHGAMKSEGTMTSEGTMDMGE